MKLPIFIGFTILVAVGHAQIVPGSTGHGQPAFNCAINDTYGDIDTNLVWQCKTQPNGWVPTPGFMPWGGSSNSPVTGVDSTFKGPRIDVRWFGAKADGTTDNCTALTSATTYAATLSNAVLYFAPGVFMTSCTTVLPAQTSIIADGWLTAKTGGSNVSTALVATGAGTGYTLWAYQSIQGTGGLDLNNVSAKGVWLRQYQHDSINGINIRNIPASGHGIHAGDSTAVGPTAGTGGYELEMQDVSFGSQSAAANSVCLYTDVGNGVGAGAATDTQYTHGRTRGCATGIVDNVGRDHYTDIHAWDQNMTTCFEDNGNGNTWIGDECDTPTTFGFWGHKFNQYIIGMLIQNNSSYGTDNVVTALQFDNTNPSAVIEGVFIIGNDVTHRFAADTNLIGANLSSTTVIGLVPSNVVTLNLGTTSWLSKVSTLAALTISSVSFPAFQSTTDSSTVPGFQCGSGALATCFFGAETNRGSFGFDSTTGNAFFGGIGTSRGLDFRAGGGAVLDTAGRVGGYTSSQLPWTRIGSAIASATTIAPTAAGVFHVTGTTPVTTITVPTDCATAISAGVFKGCELRFIPDGIVPFNTGGNIANATTSVVNRLLIYDYDPNTTKWYASY